MREGGGTVRAARAAKKVRDVYAKPTGAVRTSEPAVLATGRRLLDQLDRFRTDTVGDVRALPELLAVLRDRINSLLRLIGKTPLRPAESGTPLPPP